MNAIAFSFLCCICQGHFRRVQVARRETLGVANDELHRLDEARTHGQTELRGWLASSAQFFLAFSSWQAGNSAVGHSRNPMRPSPPLLLHRAEVSTHPKSAADLRDVQRSSEIAESPHSAQEEPEPGGGVPLGGVLYSLLHLGGFPNDIQFYSSRCGKGRVLELGAGDGRIAAHVCLGEETLSVLQQSVSEPGQTGKASHVAPNEYVGIELCQPLAKKAQKRLASMPNADVRVGDFLDPLPEGSAASYDSVLVTANTLFATSEHAKLIAQCAAALKPGGLLLLDAYNANPFLWKEVNLDDEEQAADPPTFLVRVQDETERIWQVYEHNPEVDANSQRITCKYDFHDDDTGKVFTETLVHHYMLPEQIVRLLDEQGFEIENIFGDFAEETFDAEDSDHVVVVARRRTDDH